MGKPCIFVDRDGVINVNAARGEYIRTWEEFRFIPGIAEWIRLFNALGYLVIVVTNQRGIELGVMSQVDVEHIHENMVRELAARGARIDDVFYCPHNEASCDCRKPRTGMVRQAVSKWDIDVDRSALIGDSLVDQQLAAACGLRFIAVKHGQVVDRLQP